MYKLNFLLALILPCFLLVSCSKETEETMLMNAKAKMEDAKKLEGENKAEDAKKAYIEALEIYKSFLEEYPASQRAPEVYSNIAKIYVDNLRDYPNAIKYYDELSQKHPSSKESKYGMFMVAFIYDEMMKDKEKAKENYRKFLEKYPNDEGPNEKMSESARMMLQMLDENRSIEDIIKNIPRDTVKTPNDDKKPKGDTVHLEDRRPEKKEPTNKDEPNKNEGTPVDDKKQ
jgi:tetratricopeptide (TPR) repeat protein